MFKFIHCADLHLDSPLRGLERYEGAPVDQIRGAVRRAMDNLFELAVREQVDFVVIAGDIYDGNWDDHSTGLYFGKWLSRFQQNGIPVYAITGNHDAENKMTRSLDLPLNPSGDKVMLSSTQPETVRLDDLGVAIHGRGFADQEERENLVLDYPKAIPGYFNLGMLHTSLDGAGGQHKRYAPCSPTELVDRGYQYWALGHVHTRRRHQRAGQPPIVFPGNVQGRNIRETGPKGCELVTVDDDRNVDLQFCPLDVFRFQLCEVDVQGVTEPDEVLGRFTEAMKPIAAAASGLPLAVRVIVSGASEAHPRWLADIEAWRVNLRAHAFSVAGDVWVEKVKFETSMLRQLTAQELSDGPIAELIRLFGDAASDDDLVAELLGELDGLKQKLPDEALGEHRDLIPTDTESLVRWLDEVQPMLLGRLMTEDAS